MCTVVPSCVNVDIELIKLSGKFTLKATQHEQICISSKKQLVRVREIKDKQTTIQDQRDPRY